MTYDVRVSEAMDFAMSRVAQSARKPRRSYLRGLHSFATLTMVPNSLFFSTNARSNEKSGGFWDFTSDLSKGDTAYTDLAIGPHTDNTYFTDPAGLQMFHLLSHDDGEGGVSGLVDGFAAARRLIQMRPQDYYMLGKVNVHCHASGNDGSSIQPATGFPVLVHDNYHEHLIQVRWNPADRAQIDVPVEESKAWYGAAK